MTCVHARIKKSVDVMIKVIWVLPVAIQIANVVIANPSKFNPFNTFGCNSKVFSNEFKNFSNKFILICLHGIWGGSVGYKPIDSFKKYGR